MLTIGSIGSYHDAEYQRIIRELQSLGIAPSGNKATDRSKLALAKAELVEKIQRRQNEEHKIGLQAQPIEPVDDAQNAQRTEMEEQRLGAMNVATLNRLYFGI